jgi:hypothetical protein
LSSGARIENVLLRVGVTQFFCFYKLGLRGLLFVGLFVLKFAWWACGDCLFGFRSFLYEGGMEIGVLSSRG